MFILVSLLLFYFSSSLLFLSVPFPFSAGERAAAVVAVLFGDVSAGAGDPAGVWRRPLLCLARGRRKGPRDPSRWGLPPTALAMGLCVSLGGRLLASFLSFFFFRSFVLSAFFLSLPCSFSVVFFFSPFPLSFFFHFVFPPPPSLSLFLTTGLLIILIWMLALFTSLILFFIINMQYACYVTYCGRECFC